MTYEQVKSLKPEDFKRLCGVQPETFNQMLFNYVIETNLTNSTGNTTKDKTLQRRVDGLFPPIVESVFIDARYEPMCAVED